MLDTKEPAAGDAGDPSAAAPPKKKTHWRRRLVRGVILVAAVVALFPLLDRWPREREVQLRLAAPETVTRLELTWLAADGRTPTAGRTFEFAPGAAPPLIQTQLTSAEDSVPLRIRVERAGVVSEVTQWVRFDGDEPAVVQMPR